MKYLMGIGLLAVVLWFERKAEKPVTHYDWFKVHPDGGGI